MAKILSTSFYTIFIAILLGIAGLVVATMLPIPGNIEIKIVKSGSMTPAIPTGSVVIVKPESSYALGDVITFGKDTKRDIPTTHRIVAQNADGSYTVKGDANEEEDPNPVPRGSVIGKVIFHLPYLGFVLAFARTTLGFAFLIGVPAALVILEEIMTIIREVRRGMRKRKHDDDDTPAARGGGNRQRIIYARPHRMDEIFVPMILHTQRMRRAWKHGPFAGDAYGTATALVVALVCASSFFSAASQGTLSYFSDIERSLDNMFGAGIWTFATTTEETSPQPSLAAFMAPQPESEAPIEDDNASTTPGIVLGTSDEKTDEPPADENATTTEEVTAPAPEQENEEHAPPEEPGTDTPESSQEAPQEDPAPAAASDSTTVDE